MEENGLPKPDDVIFGEIQVLLSEKRTALAGLRTGIAVFALPLSVLSPLIATSRYYNIERVMPLLLPLMLLNLGWLCSGPGWSSVPSVALDTSSTASGSSATNIDRSRSS